MSGPKGYSSYRGKGPKVKIALAVFLVLVILAAVSVIRLQKYVVYDDSGRPRLELPQAIRNPSTSSSGDSSTPQISVPDLTIQEAEKSSAVMAMGLPLGALSDWTAMHQQLNASGVAYNAVVYTVKDAEGNAYFDSQSVPLEARKTVEGSAAAIAEMTGTDGLYAIARLSCFRDPVASTSDLEGRGLKNTGGYIFYDGNNDRWMDPSKPAARKYLCALAAECAQMGFDEILLSDVSYPTVGKLGKIDYGAAVTDLSAGLSAFLKEMRTALAAYDVALSIELPAVVVTTGGDAVSGQALAALAPLVDRVYTAADTAQQIETLAAAVAAVSETADFVPALPAAPIGETYLCQLHP